MTDVVATKDGPLEEKREGEPMNGSSLGMPDDDPLSFESNAKDYLDIVGVPAAKRGAAVKALRAAIMACMSEDYPEGA